MKLDDDDSSPKETGDDLAREQKKGEVPFGRRWIDEVLGILKHMRYMDTKISQERPGCYCHLTEWEHVAASFSDGENLGMEKRREE